MRPIGRAGWTWAVALWLAYPGASKSQEADPRPGLAVDRVLGEWHRKASTITSVEARFRLKAREPIGVEKASEGRVVLAAPNLASMELREVDPKGPVHGLKSREIWNGRTFLQFDFDERRVTRFPIREEWAESPAPLRLPFFYRMTVAEAKQSYDWAVLQEDASRIVLSARARSKPRPSTVADHYLLTLDATTYLPRSLIVSGPRGAGREVYEVVDIKLDQVKDLDELKAPCLDAWYVVERDDWLTRLFLR